MLMTRAHRITVSAGRGLRLAVRRLWQRPGYAASATLTLAIGAGGAATVFSAANWVLLRPVPGVQEPDGLVRLRLETVDDNNAFAWPISQPDLESLRDGSPSLVSLAASSPDQVHLQVGDAPVARINAELVTADYFAVLEISPAAGRVFVPEEHGIGTSPSEIVIGHRIWRRYWDGQRNAIGDKVRVNGRVLTVVGVMPRGFSGAELPGSAEAWISLADFDVVRPMTGAATLTNRMRGTWSDGVVVGRLAAGAGIMHVAADAARVMEDVRRDYPRHSFLANHLVFRVYRSLGLSPWVAQDVRKTLALLTGASGFLLILVIANVGNMALARITARDAHMATCRALGASTTRLMSEPLLEGATLGALGSVAGVALGWIGIRLFRDASLSTLGASLDRINMDLRVIGVTVAVAMTASVLASVPSSLAVVRRRATLIGSTRHETRNASRVRSMLVVLQVALSAVLLVGAGLLTRTVLELRSIELGFDPSSVVTFSLEPGLHGYEPEQIFQLVRDLEARLLREPGVQTVGITQPALLQGWQVTGAVFSRGEREEPIRVIGARFDVSPGFLETLGVRLVGGHSEMRPGASTASSSADLLLSVSAARAVFPGRSPQSIVGNTVGVGATGQNQAIVVGVFEDAQFVDIRAGRREIVLQAWRNELTSMDLTVYVKSNLPPPVLLARVREIVRELDAEIPVYAFEALAQVVEGRMVEERLLARLSRVLAAIGLILAAVGLAGVMGYVVTERSKEIGIRGALGASPTRILTAIIGRGLVLTVIGALAGILTSVPLARMIAARLFDVAAVNGFTYGVVLVVLGAVGVVASGIPGRRAMRISPVDALREN